MEEQKFLKGLFKDSGEVDQPSNTWRYALNALMNEQKGSVSNESGNKLSGYIKATLPSIPGQKQWPHWEKIIGAIEIDLNRAILFVCDTRPLIIDPTDVDKNYYPRHSIQLWDGVKSEHQKVTMLFKPVTSFVMGAQNTTGCAPVDLNFKETHPIEGIFRIDSKEDVIIYWTDDLNPPRALNITRQLRHITVTSPISQSKLYGLDPCKSHRKHINLLNLFPAAGTIPQINSRFANASFNLIGQGGGLLTGVYYLAVAYIDEDFVETNYLTVSNPVSIVPEYSYTRPTTKRDGAKSGTQTSKSITWNVQNLNTDYKYIKCAVIRKKDDAVDVFKLTDKVITGDMALGTNMLQITFSGTEGFEPLKMEDVMIDTVGYDTAKSITQMDNVLYMGNLTGSPDLGYQKYANNIKASSHVRKIENFDQQILSVDNLYSGFANTPVDSFGSGSTGVAIDDKNSYRDPEMNTFYRGYRRGEVYAFYIAFVLNNGSMSYAYHIPGREPIQAQPIWPERYSSAFGGSTTRGDYEYWALPIGVGNNPILDHQRELHNGTKIFHFYDVSEHTSGTDANARPNGAPRNMRYWHNLNEVYPHTPNSEVWDKSTYKDPTTGLSINLVNGFYNSCPNCNNGTTYEYPGGMHGMYVRHHHMPSNINPFATMISEDVWGGSQESATIDVTTPGIFAGSFFTAINQNNFWHSSGYSDTKNCQGKYQPLAAPTLINYAAGTLGTEAPPFNASLDKFVSVQDNTQVVVDVYLLVSNDNNGCTRTFSYKLKYKKCGSCSTQTAASGSREVMSNWVSLVNFQDTVFVDAGGSIWMEGKGDQGGTSLNWCAHKGPDCGSHERHIKYNQGPSYGITWTVSQVTGTGQDYDVNLNHDVNVLGVSFDDINIPKSYYDKIQGFRIYYAKRSFSNKRMIGQAPVIPMTNSNGRIGICSEVLNGGTSNTPNPTDIMDQTLNISGGGAEPFIAKEAWALEPSAYSITNTPGQSLQNQHSVQDSGGSFSSVGTGFDAYKYFIFYDFNLLRTHSTISPATYIELTYVVNNWVWNGPDIKQSKKMLSEISLTSGVPDVSDSGLYKITERWGWDDPADPRNCYPENIKSAIFAGGRYFEANKFMGNRYLLQRFLSQKAKTYLNGDSILKAKPLGFPGQIINTYGDSTIAFALRDRTELPALYSSQDGTLGATYFNGGAVSNSATQCIFGTPDPAGSVVFPFLANPNLGISTYTNFYLEANEETEADATSSMTYIANLCAFKTDVYRSIDNQDLVWTGFQVVGEDLYNYFFDDEYQIIDYQDPTSNSYGTTVANPNFGLQWRPDTFLTDTTTFPQITIVGDGIAGNANLTFNADGTVSGATLTNPGSGYTYASASADYNGAPMNWLTFTVTVGGGNITNIQVNYTTNTFKIETGECMSYCTGGDPSIYDNQNICENGQCTHFGAPVDDDPNGITGISTPLTDQATCESHGFAVTFQAGLPPIVNTYSGLTNAEAAAADGGSVTMFLPYVWMPPAGLYVNDCGGIYGGDTIISRHGISTGASVLEESRESNPTHAIHHHIVESEDNINFRHMENKDSTYFPSQVAIDVLKEIGVTLDPTSEKNLKYDHNYSALNDVRTAFPLPLKVTDQSNFPTRTIRSTVNDATGIKDNYRVWLANQFKDLPKNRGELWKLSTFANLIYFHMEQSLFKAAGKQTMQMGDGSDAFVGSGDIFKQEPTEVVQTEGGYGGTQSQFAALTTRYGYFFVDRKGKKVFMMKDQLLEISALGMENWFIENMDFELITKYGASELDRVDNPIAGLGFHSTWDPYNKRIILTKRELKPTQAFKDGWALQGPPPGYSVGEIRWHGPSNSFQVYYTSKGMVQGWRNIMWGDETYFTKDGWTISYYPDQAVWCSFHSYVPYLYFNTSETFFSVTDKYPVWTGIGDATYPAITDFMTVNGTTMGNKGIWEHNFGLKGLFYQDNLGAVLTQDAALAIWNTNRSTFELEVIQNTLRGFDTLTASIGFMADVYNTETVRVLNHGFTSFYVYNTFQISGDEVSSPLEYLVNVRRIGNKWKINKFRDFAADVVQTDNYYVPDATWSGGVTTTNVTGNVSAGTQTSDQINSMFTRSGMSELVTPAYLDFTKNMQQQRKFIDKWIGIRLIYDNITNNLLNLYSTHVEARKMYR